MKLGGVQKGAEEGARFETCGTSLSNKLMLSQTNLDGRSAVLLLDWGPGGIHIPQGGTSSSSSVKIMFGGLCWGSSTQVALSFTLSVAKAGSSTVIVA